MINIHSITFIFTFNLFLDFVHHFLLFDPLPFLFELAISLFNYDFGFLENEFSGLFNLGVTLMFLLLVVDILKRIYSTEHHKKPLVI